MVRAPMRWGVGGDIMKSKTKIWLGVGAVVVAGGTTAFAGSAVPGATAITDLRTPQGTQADTAVPRHAPESFVVAQHARHGGEGGEGEGGEKGAAAKLPPDLAFALRVAQMRGHLLVGDELVKAGQWAAALPHFLHPGEEIYGDIRGQLKDYKVAPFEAALKVLASTVKSRKGGDAYAKAWKTVSDALDSADAGLKQKVTGWDGFTVETALELLKTAAGEYEAAIVKGRFAKPVEYQDARGFVFYADRMIESVAPELEKKDAESLKHVRDAMAELKKAFPAPMPPKAPVKDVGGVLSDVSRVELSAGKLM
jgi:hypothetical protein